MGTEPAIELRVEEHMRGPSLHEAGHALVAYVERVDLTDVKVTGNGGTCRGHDLEGLCKTQPTAILHIALAGAIGETRTTRIPYDHKVSKGDRTAINLAVQNQSGDYPGEVHAAKRVEQRLKELEDVHISLANFIGPSHKQGHDQPWKDIAQFLRRWDDRLRPSSTGVSTAEDACPNADGDI